MNEPSQESNNNQNGPPIWICEFCQNKSEMILAEEEVWSTDLVVYLGGEDQPLSFALTRKSSDLVLLFVAPQG